MCELFFYCILDSDCFETSMGFKKSFGLTSLLIFILLCFTGYLYLEVLSEPRYSTRIFILLAVGELPARAAGGGNSGMVSRDSAKQPHGHSSLQVIPKCC
jgi:hypothetical protein